MHTGHYPPMEDIKLLKQKKKKTIIYYLYLSPDFSVKTLISLANKILQRAILFLGQKIKTHYFYGQENENNIILKEAGVAS